MPNRDSEGIRFLAQLQLGHEEMQWWQDELGVRAALARLGLAHECGWLASYVGPLPDLGWEVYHVSGGALAIRSESAGVATPYPISRLRSPTQPFLGVDPGGEIIPVAVSGSLFDDSDAVLTVPDDSTWYTIKASRRLQRREPGTLTLVAGSTTVTGVGTKFTRLGDGTDPRAARIRIDAADTINGNDGTYVIATITSDTSMVLETAAVASESGVYFRTKGLFYSAVPADPDCHSIPVTAWELVTRTTTRPTSGLIYGDVTRTGGTVTFIDRRHASLLQPRTGDVGFSVQPRILTSAASGVPLVDWKTAFNDSTASYQARFLAAAPAGTGEELYLGTAVPTGILLAVARYDTTDTDVLVRQFSPAAFDDPWHDPAGAPVTVVSTVSGPIALVAVPPGSGRTHLLFYLTSPGNDAKYFWTADNGLTWTGPVDVILGDFSAVSACLTRMGRLILTLIADNLDIGYVYSDDYGVTWVTDTGPATFEINTITSGSATSCSTVEDDRGNLWTVVTTTQSEGNNPVRVYRGRAEGNPSPSDAEQPVYGALGFRGWPVGNESLAQLPTESAVAAIAMPGGQVGAFVNLDDPAPDTSDGVAFVQIGRQHHLASRMVATVVSGTYVPVACCATASGEIHLFYPQGDATGAKVIHLPLLPVSFERSHSWFGGV